MTPAKNTGVSTELNQTELDGLTYRGATQIVRDRQGPVRVSWAWAVAGHSFDWMDWHEPELEIEA
jgi:hypothetical protein